MDKACIARIHAIRPRPSPRMGAAIRHATAQLSQRGEHQRLLLILTHGKPNDLDATKAVIRPGRHPPSRAPKPAKRA